MKLFLIDGGKAFAHSAGRFNETLHRMAIEHLGQLGHEIQHTRIEDGYETAGEVEKFLWADAIIYQMPGWWMGAPWTVKKYIDDVFTEGHGKLYANDGRSRHDPAKQYGSGGLLQGRQYMLSLTWNAPIAAFDEPGNFFEGRGVDGVYFPFHKSQEFVGLAGLPTFIANDVIKAPDIARDLAAYRTHLTDIFGANSSTNSSTNSPGSV